MKKTISKLDRLKAKRQELEDKLWEAEKKETERFSRIGWGTGMRCSKINFSTRRSDSLRERIKEVDRQIAELRQNNHAN